jgi:hypothetical protein
MRLWVGLVMGSLWFGGVAVAHPTMGLPEVSSGSHPYRVFAGEVSAGTTRTLFDVPEDQELIITMVLSSMNGTTLTHSGTPFDGGIELLSDGVTVLTNHTIGSNSRVSIAQGDGKLPIAAGSVLSIRNRSLSGAATYNIQGHLVEAGSPYRSFMGHTPLATHGLQAVFTADADRDFLIRTLAVRSVAGDEIDVYMDGTLFIERHTAAHSYGDDRPLWAGKGLLPIPAGSTLQLKTNGYYVSYYIDGEYLTP